MKLDKLISQLQEAREFLGQDAEVFIGDPNGAHLPIHEVWSDKDYDHDKPGAVIQSYIVRQARDRT